MKKYRLKITAEDFVELKRLVLANIPNEAGAFALAGVSNLDNQVDILVRRLIEVPQSLFKFQSDIHLELSSQAINGLISLCESNNLGAVFCHSHPSGLRYSPSDDYGELRLVKSLREFIPQNAPIASLLFTPDKVTGRVWIDNHQTPENLYEIVILGQNLQSIKLGNNEVNPVVVKNQDLYDRQVRAFGKEGQETIANSKVGIIGIGGTGSPIAEQLVRLGVLDILLIDPDTISPSNLTRVYGTYQKSVLSAFPHPEFKADIVAANLRKINPKANISTMNKNVVLSIACHSLLDRDILFLCTDEHWGRSIVNQISYQYLIPTINLGVTITSNNGKITNAIGVLDVIRPRNACLWCKQFLQADRITAESVPVEYRQRLIKEGYVDNIDTHTPSVISFTSTMASQAVSLFLNFHTNFMSITGNISRLNFDFLTGLSRRGTTPKDPTCICQKVMGYGDLRSIPTLETINPLEK